MSKIENNNEAQYIEIDSFFEDDEKDLEIKEETKSKKKTSESKTKNNIKRRKNKDGSFSYDATLFKGNEKIRNEDGTVTYRPVRVKKTFPNRALAEYWLKEEQGKIAKLKSKGKKVNIRSVTVIQAIDDYYDECVRNKKSDEFLRDKRREQKVIKAYFNTIEKKYVSQIVKKDIENFLNYLYTTKEYKYSNIQKHKSHLSQVWEFMMDEQDYYNISSNVVKPAKLPVEKEHKKVEVPTPEQLEELFLEACDYYDPTFLYLAVMSRTAGFRRGEMAGLMWGDIDWVNNKITIQHNRIQVIEKRSKVKLPKTEKIRIFEMHKHVIDVLKLYKEWQEEILGRPVKDNEFVLQWEINLKKKYTCSVGKISRRWMEICNQINKNRIKLGKEELKYTGLHDGRHIYSTWCLVGVVREDGTKTPSANVFQTYFSMGHSLPRGLQNTTTEVYMEDNGLRDEVTAFWNSAVKLNIYDEWMFRKELRESEFDALPEIDKMILNNRRQKELDKAEREHYQHMERRKKEGKGDEDEFIVYEEFKKGVDKIEFVNNVE